MSGAAGLQFSLRKEHSGESHWRKDDRKRDRLTNHVRAEVTVLYGQALPWAKGDVFKSTHVFAERDLALRAAIEVSKDHCRQTPPGEIAQVGDADHSRGAHTPREPLF